jgi:uncharacterized YccA/Bax inhibitor family protein
MILNENESSIALTQVKKKTLLLLLISFVSAFVYWKILAVNIVGDEIANGMGIPSILIPFLLGGLYMLKDRVRVMPIALAMSVCAGIFLGSMSGVLERGVPGLVSQAILATFITTLSVVYLYKNKYIKVNNKFLQFTVFIFNTILWILAADFILSFIILDWRSLINGASTSVIVINVLVMLLGYLVFSIDLNIIDQKINNQLLSEDQSWRFAIDLLLDIAWIYLAILFLIARFRGKKD